MSWGLGPWGTGPWGGPGAAGPIGGPTVHSISPTLAEVEGGTVLTIFGTNFIAPLTVELYDGVPAVVGEAKYFEPRLDIRLDKMKLGFPALPAGSYGLKVITPYGTTPLIPDAVTYKIFAQEGKVHRVRRRWATAWVTGERLDQ